MSVVPPAGALLRLRGRVVGPDRPVVMAVVNRTPDSFYAPARYDDATADDAEEQRRRKARKEERERRGGSDGSDGRGYSRRNSLFMDTTPRSSWWKKLTGS